MTETYFARITEVLPSRVVTIISVGNGEPAIVRSFDSTPLIGVIDLQVKTVFKITIETNPGEVIMRYSPANKNNYHE